MKSKKMTVFLILTCVLMLLTFTFNYFSSLHDIEEEGAKQAARIAQDINMSGNFIDLMGVYGNDFLSSKVAYQSDIFQYLTYDQEANRYHMDSLKGTGLEWKAGNLTGLGTIPQEEAGRREIELALSYNHYFLTISEKLPEITWLYYTSDKDFLNIFPWAPSSEFTFLPDLKQTDFFVKSSPKENPERLKHWSPVYMDLAGAGLMVTVSKPIYENNTFRGVVSLDFTNEDLSKAVQSPYYTVLLDNQLNVIASSEAKDLGQEITTAGSLTSLAGIDPETISDHVKIGSISKYRDNYIYYREFDGAPWKLIVVVPIWEIVARSLLYTIPILIISFLMMYAFREIGIRRKAEELVNQKIQEQLATQKVLAENEERFKRIFSMTPEPVAFVRASGRIILDVNEAFVAKFGYQKEELIGHTAIELGLWGKSTDYEKTIEILNETGQLMNFRSLFKGKEGETFVGILSARTIDFGGEPHILILIRDISQEIQAQQEIEKLNKRIQDSLEDEVEQRTQELKEAMEQLLEKEKMASLGSLVSGISHEINTPLGIGVTTASYMEKLNNESRQKIADGKMTKNDLLSYMENLDESLKILEGNLYRAAELIKSFKTIAVNQHSEVCVRFNLLEYINYALLSLRHEYKNKNYTFEIDCPENLMIYNYPGAISQILTNLIMNAIVHGFKNRDQGKVIITAAEQEDHIMLTFSDDGVGIPEANIKRIYEPFFTTNREHGGSGLGMNIIYNLVTSQLKGTIKCISSEEKGTTFIIMIPREGSCA